MEVFCGIFDNPNKAYKSVQKIRRLTSISWYAGADPNAETNSGSTALSTVFLSRDITISLTDYLKKDWFSIEKKRELANILIKAGADINRGSENCLCELVKDSDFENNLESIKLAIELGADVNKACDDENILEMTDNPEVIKILKEAGAKKVQNNW